MKTRALVALLLSSLLLLPSRAGSAPSEKGGPDFHRPKVGVCYDYGIKGLYAVSGPQGDVSCDESHRAITVAVPRVAHPIDRKHPLKAFEEAGTRCYRAAYAALGGTPKTRALTAYSISYYVPTQAEVDHGARWVRCDLLLYGGTRLLPLPDPYLPSSPDDSTALCLTRETGGATVCDLDHKFRATGLVKVSGDDYPTEQRFNRIARQRCKSRTASPHYLWRWPNEQSWYAGKHLITCYSKTKD